jgi:hypothetical protein
MNHAYVWCEFYKTPNLYAMKTSNYLKSKSIRNILILTVAFLLTGIFAVTSQETNAIFNEDPETGFIWGFDVKTSSIQGEIGTQYSMFAGTLFHHSVLIGATGALNVSHPTVNYGYLGFMIQYTLKPDRIFHMSGQLTLGSGSTKDYQQEKSNPFDNLGNVTGAKFYFIEPVLNGEINLGIKTRIVLGLGYRFVNGLNPDNENISITHVSDTDLSGITFSAGVKFGLY